ncbi:hypothetical protein [uncultured Capnocytophaga sp.]|uniref:hypothetical protein n=1 Tax=uncultured Capnocytophaga sp. TaxID=159273 RepID=UPI0028E553DA|nr:hypothetical protein [uncultured Capnocytophaga sp.]
MFKKLLEIIHSDEFRVQLAELNNNFFNLKQELHIRDLLLVLFNKYHSQEGFRAIAEYRVKNIRIDLALVKRSPKEEILIEFKYHFPKDPQIEKKQSLKKYFEERKECDYLISIVCNGNKEKREQFEEKWLNKETIFADRYSGDSQWKEKLVEELKPLGCSFESIEIEVDKPFKTTYHFFILERRKVIFPLR